MQDSQEHTEKRARSGADGVMYLYVITAGEFCKIGITNHLNLRLKQYQVHCPLRIEMPVIQEVKADRARMLEREVHMRLAKHRARGEWFLCKPDKAKAAISKVRRGMGLPLYAGGLIQSGAQWPSTREPATPRHTQETHDAG